MATAPTAPTFTRYRDHHQIIRAIEKCSLQATFGPEITSTGDLLPKEPDVSSVLTLRSSHDTIIRPIEERDEVPFDLANSHSNTSLLPIDPTNEDGNVFSDPTIDDEDDNDNDNDSDDVSVFLTNQDDNIHSQRFTNGSTVRPTSEREDGMTLFQQQLGHSPYFGRVPLEILDQKIEEVRQWTDTQRIYRDIHDLSYSNHKHPNHNRVWDSKNLFCIGCTKDTMKVCENCGMRCCLWSACKEIADAPKAGILPQERVDATRWLKTIASLVSYGIDEPTFLACARCQKALCPKCTSICEICDALSCPDCCGYCPTCEVPKCVRCKPNREEECSYHRGPPAI